MNTNEITPEPFKTLTASEFVESYLGSDKSDGLDEFSKCVDAYNAGLVAGTPKKQLLAEKIFALLERTRESAQAAHKFGLKNPNTEKSKTEAIDSLIFSLFLFYNTQGTQEEFAELLDQRLLKLTQKI